MDVAIQAWLDQEDAHIGAMVRPYGWFIQYVGGSEMFTLPGCRCSDDQDMVPFAYTVGLFGLQHPELLIFGVPQETRAEFSTTLASRYGPAMIFCREN
jgi:hypothetical protein